MSISFDPVPLYAGNLTDTELARHIEHHYPRLSGPLLEMFTRFSRPEKRQYGEPRQVVAPSAVECACPHCGSPFTIDDESHRV